MRFFAHRGAASGDEFSSEVFYLLPHHARTIPSCIYQLVSTVIEPPGEKPRVPETREQRCGRPFARGNPQGKMMHHLHAGLKYQSTRPSLVDIMVFVKEPKGVPKRGGRPHGRFSLWRAYEVNCSYKKVAKCGCGVNVLF